MAPNEEKLNETMCDFHAMRDIYMQHAVVVKMTELIENVLWKA